MELAAFIEEMKNRAERALLALSGDGRSTAQSFQFGVGRAEITTIRTSAVEKASISHMALEGVPDPVTGNRFDTTVYQMEIFPTNPHCPMGHFNVESTVIGAEATYHMNLDIFPATEHEADAAKLRGVMDAVADRFGLDRTAAREGLGLQYRMPHWPKPLAAMAGFQLKAQREGRRALLYEAYRAFFDAYADTLERRKNEPYTAEEDRARLERNGRWLEYIALKDRAVKAALAIGIPSEVIIALSFPPSAVF